MENFKFITNQKPLTPDDILAHKDFDKVLFQYNKLPLKFYKTGWFKAGLASVTVVATGTFLFFDIGNDKDKLPEQKVVAVNEIKKYNDESPCVNSPNKSIDLAYTKFQINAEKDTVLNYEAGSAIIYKGGSLIDANGVSVKGKIEINYREFHNAAEVFASGIPMRYDSSGNQFHLKSAGMIEILAKQNGENIFIRPNHEIQIQLKSNVNDGAYNVYYLDTIKDNWKYLAKDKTIEENLKSTGSNKNLNKNSIKIDTLKIAAINHLKKPIQPKKLNPSLFNFELDVLPDEFPELAIYKSTKFEVVDNKNVFTSQMFTTEWEDASLKEIKKGEEYELVLSRGSVKKSFLAIPVFEGDDYRKAIKEYTKKYDEYNKLLSQKINEEKEKTNVEEMSKSQWEKEAYAKNKNRIQNFTADINNELAMNRFGDDTSPRGLITRCFSVSKFGIWNCDSPKNLPEGEKVMAEFYDENKNKIPLTEVWLCEKDNKMLYSYEYNEFKKFKFNPKNKNIIWGITSNGTLAYALEESFTNATKKGKIMQFNMKIVKEKIKTIKEVKDLLEI